MIKLASFDKLLIINIENHVRNISNNTQFSVNKNTQYLATTVHRIWQQRYTAFFSIWQFQMKRKPTLPGY